MLTSGTDALCNAPRVSIPRITHYAARSDAQTHRPTRLCPAIAGADLRTDAMLLRPPHVASAVGASFISVGPENVRAIINRLIKDQEGNGLLAEPARHLLAMSVYH